MNEEEITFGMLKPEALERMLIGDIYNRIEFAGLKIEQRVKKKLSEKEFKAIYGHTEETVPTIYQKLKVYLTTNEVVLLKIVGIDAIKKLLNLRGASNPSKAKKGSIRGDYAYDQGYEQVYKSGNISLNVFHAADSKEEAEKMINLFFS